MLFGSDEQKNQRNDSSSKKDAGDQELVARVAVGHRKACEGGRDKADRDEEEEDLQRERVSLGSGWRRGWSGCLRSCGIGAGSRRWFRAAWSDDRRLVLMDLREGDDPGGRLIGAAALPLMEVERLQRTTDSKEQERWSNEDTEVEVGEANGAEKVCGSHECVQVSACVGLPLEAVAGFGDAEERSPDEAIDGDNHQRHDDGGEQQDLELAVVGGCGDLGAEADGLQGLAFEVEVLGDDGGVPGATGGGDEAGEEEGKDAGEDDGAPALRRW